jgi:hypothetical protein
MLVSHVDVRTDDDGAPIVSVTFDLTAVQVGAVLHALRTVRDARHRTQEMSADDVVAMRDLTSLVDELSAFGPLEAAVRLRATPARLGALRDALDEFAAAEHQEREGDSAARPLVFALVDSIADLHAEAIRAALEHQG